MREEETTGGDGLRRAGVVGLAGRDLGGGFDLSGYASVDWVHAGQNVLIPHQQLKGKNDSDQ